MLAAALEAEVDAYVTVLADERRRARAATGGAQRPRRAPLAGHRRRSARGPGTHGSNDRRVDEETGERALPQLDPAAVGPQVAQGGRGAPADLSARDELGGLRPGARGVLRLGGRTVGLGHHPAHDEWQHERDQFARRSLNDGDYVYLFADGIHFNVRLEEDRLCALVIVGVRTDGTKELVSITDGHRESTESWADVLRGLQRRGMTRPSARRRRRGARVLGGLRDVFPETKDQRCWVHKMANVLNALPKSAQPPPEPCSPRSATPRTASTPRRRSRLRQGLRGQVAQGRREGHEDLEELLAFFDFPAEHWVHLKTTNPIESTFATVRLRTKVTKGPGSRAAGLAMAYKLIESAQTRWRAINAPHLVALVRAGAKFEKGVMVERSDELNEEVAA